MTTQTIFHKWLGRNSGAPGVNAGRLADACPPGCWHYVVQRDGQAMRWTPEWPALRFGPAGLPGDDQEVPR